MKLILFRSGRNEVVDIRLPHVTASLQASHVCYSDGEHGETEGEVLVHRVTDAHLVTIHDAIGCTNAVPFRVERNDGLWLRAEGYNGRQAAIRLADSYGPVVTAAIEEAMARQELHR